MSKSFSERPVRVTRNVKRVTSSTGDLSYALRLTRYASKIQWVLALLYVCLVPIGWSPFPANIQWADVVFVGLLIAVLADKFRFVKFIQLDWFIVLYLLGSLASFWRTADLAQSSLELVKQGYLVLVYGVFSALARQRGGADTILLWSAEVAAILAGASLFALVMYVVSGMGVFELLLSPAPVPLLGDVARIKGALLSPAFFCNYLTVALPIVLAHQFRPPHRIGGRPLNAGGGRFATLMRMFLVMAAALGTLTYSIVGFLGAGLTGLWRSWSSTPALRALRNAAVVVFLLVFLAGNVVFAVSLREIRWTTDTNPEMPRPPSGYGFQPETMGAQRLSLSVSYNPMSYGLLKRVAAQAFLREPLTGIGLGRFHDETERAYHLGLIHAPYRRADPHCELLGRLAETGLVGGLTLLLLWGGIARVGRELLRRPSSGWVPGAILAGCVGLLVNSVNADVMNFRFLWLGLGLLRGQLNAPKI